jgi:hypothetical protein
MANDRTAMIFRIAAELGARFDLGGLPGSATQSAPNSEAIRNAISTAISEYQKQRFRFNEVDPALPTTFVTQATRSVYDSSDNAQIGELFYIDYLNIAIGNTLQKLYRVDPETQHLNIQLFNQSGFPSSWAYEGNKIILYPVPDQPYTLYIGAHLFFAEPASDSEANNVWMTGAELLIRSRAKYEIACHVTRNEKMQALMSPEINGNNGQPGQTYRAWQSLKAEGNKITSTGRIKAMKF